MVLVRMLFFMNGSKKGISLSKKKKRKNAQERVAVLVMMDGFPVGVEIDGKENRRW